ncbi:MAG: aquaporin [Chloroflexota bacterium]|nr:aquaporin [Chloroflexota bacterium]
MNESNLRAELTAEFFGTFLLMIFGNGAVAVSVWTGGYDLWAVSLMWAIGVLLGVYAAGAVSGGHINPAVTVAQAAFGDFEWKKVPPYALAQTLGAFVATACVHISFGGVLAAFEAAEGLVRGAAGSQLSAMAYTTYAPNPAIVGTAAEHFAQVTLLRWFASEVIITAVLVFAIFVLIDQRNEGRPLANTGPLMIGLLVGALVAYEAPVSMAALNPARDLGPRIWALLAGWGEIAFPGPRGGFWIPTVSTLVGGLVGGGIYAYLYKGVFSTPEKTEEA